MKKLLSILLVFALVVQVSALELRNPEIIDGATIGAASAGSGAFTTLTASGAVTINDASADIDTRIESDGNANMLHVDGGDDAVGIGKDPTAGNELDVAGDVVASGNGDFAKLLSEKIVLDTVQTFVDEDTTPDVGDYSYFNTNTTAATITDFDGSNIEDGQIIYVISKGAITYDVTSSGIKGGTTDIVTAAGDLTAFLYDGTDWYVIARIDASDDLN